MGRPKGMKPRKWSVEEKLRIVNRYFDEGIGIKRLAREENIDHGLLNRWIHKYLDEGEAGLEHKYNHKGNPYAALTTSKHLTEVERMKLIIAQQQITIERLKKGYQVKGVGLKKEFVTIKDVNMK